MPLYDKTLTKYCETFVGYGSLEGPLWFIGMEEGGAKNLNLVARRFQIWQSIGNPRTMDVAWFHQQLRYGANRFAPTARLQPTWNMLIHAYLVARGRPSTKNDKRQFQISHLGRTNADHCLLELMPLPSPSKKAWIYSGATCAKHLPWLKTRTDYEDQWRCYRIMLIKWLICQYKPRAVVMYGTSHNTSWAEIAGGQFTFDSQGIGYRKQGSTCYFALPHPTARGTTLQRWTALGGLLQRC